MELQLSLLVQVTDLHGYGLLAKSSLLLFSLIIPEVALEHLCLKRVQPSQTASYLQMVGCFPHRLSKDFKHLAISQQIDSTQVHVPLATHRVTL